MLLDFIGHINQWPPRRYLGIRPVALDIASVFVDETVRRFFRVEVSRLWQNVLHVRLAPLAD